MGWGDCGNDSNGRPIGYVFEAICDHPGCNKKIDRGLSYVCGDMHGEDEYSCEKYFCYDHRQHCLIREDNSLIVICDECAKCALESGDMIENEDGEIVHKTTEENKIDQSITH